MGCIDKNNKVEDDKIIQNLWFTSNYVAEIISFLNSTREVCKNNVYKQKLIFVVESLENVKADILNIIQNFED